MNEELLKQAVKAIEANPESHDQATWGHSPEADAIYAEDMRRTDDAFRMPLERRGSWVDHIQPWWDEKDRLLADIVVNPEVCGTKMCLAGHIVTQAGYRFNELGRIIDLGEFNGQEVEHVAWQLLGVADPMQGNIYEMFGADFGQDGYGETTVESFKEALTDLTGIEFD